MSRRGSRKPTAFLIKLFAFRLATIKANATVLPFAGYSANDSVKRIWTSRRAVPFAGHQGIDRAVASVFSAALLAVSSLSISAWVCVTHF